MTEEDLGILLMSASLPVAFIGWAIRRQRIAREEREARAAAGTQAVPQEAEPEVAPEADEAPEAEEPLARPVVAEPERWVEPEVEDLPPARPKVRLVVPPKPEMPRVAPVVPRRDIEAEGAAAANAYQAELARRAALAAAGMPAALDRLLRDRATGVEDSAWRLLVGYHERLRDSAPLLARLEAVGRTGDPVFVEVDGRAMVGLFIDGSTLWRVTHDTEPEVVSWLEGLRTFLIPGVVEAARVEPSMTPAQVRGAMMALGLDDPAVLRAFEAARAGPDGEEAMRLLEEQLDEHVDPPDPERRELFAIGGVRVYAGGLDVLEGLLWGDPAEDRLAPGLASVHPNPDVDGRFPLGETPGPHGLVGQLADDVAVEPVPQGFRIARVREGSFPWLLGVRQGQVVGSVGGLPVSSVEEALAARDAMRDREEIPVELVRLVGRRRFPSTATVRVVRGS
ncbi:MAG: hypothetical protein H6736_19630 [Alphaproteobacteria bacterium]|nr:hypothetical protein [Alphaproteobacteria bacterium]MCB9694024.1 hypothetical protein [Alphaproteobacteria bacterium]